jgi:hypothetical protein
MLKYIKHAPRASTMHQNQFYRSGWYNYPTNIKTSNNSVFEAVRKEVS